MAEKHTSGLSLKAIVERKKNKVIFVEAGSDFVDVLFSLLTIPVGTVITLEQKQSVPTRMGCITNVHESVEKMDVQYFHFHSNAGKLMLLWPCTEAGSYYENLKLKIDNTAPTQIFFHCSQCKLLSPYKDVPCKCQRPMTSEIQLTKSSSEKQTGGFLNEKIEFLVTDELQVVRTSSAVIFSLFAKHGITDDSSIEEVVFNLTADKLLKLLVCSIVTKTPWTKIVLKQIDALSLNYLNLHDKNISIESVEDEKVTTDQGTNITVKLTVSKSKKIVCYAEASKDFVNLLFSFLTVPLNYVVRNFSGDPFRGCIHHLYRSVEDLGEQYFKSNSHKDILVNPRLAFGFCYRNDLFGIEKSSHPMYYYDGYRITTVTGLIPSYYGETLFNVIGSTSDNSDGNGNDGGFISSKPTTVFMVTDNLIISPLLSSSCLSILKELKVPYSDIEEKVVHVGKDEALRLLLSSFLSGSALTNVFMGDSN